MYHESKHLHLPSIDAEILQFWEDEQVFQRSVDQRPTENSFVFYEGPPSANGKPGIHHVMARTVKDIFCRYHTLHGRRVERKGGWDTHGLPIELQVEKELGYPPPLSEQHLHRYIKRLHDLTANLPMRFPSGSTKVPMHSFV